MFYFSLLKYIKTLYLKSLFNFLSSFSRRSGNYILAASIGSRLLSFFASWIALQIILDKKLGVVIYAFQIILFITPIASLGINQGLIRYGSFLNTNKEKNNLFSLVLKKGLLISILFTALTILISTLINFDIPITSFYLKLLALAFIGQFLFEILQIQFRLLKKNKAFAFTELIYNIILVLLVFSLSFYFKELGYAIAIVLTPLLTFLIFIKRIKFNWKTTPNFDFINSTFWRYGLFASMANVTSVLLISIDILLIGNILSDMEMVTAFKYISLIPFSILFLSRAFMATDFVEFTEKLTNKEYIYSYIKNYILLFSFISIGFLAVISVFGKFLLSLFDPEYVHYFSTLLVLTFGITGLLILRGLFGNLLSSIGKSHVNFIIIAIAILLNIVLNYYLIPTYGIFGAAITSAFLMWFTGVFCMIFFFYYYTSFINQTSSKK